MKSELSIAYDARSMQAGGTGDRTYFREIIGGVAQSQPQSTLCLYAREIDAEREELARRFANVRSVPIGFAVGALWNQFALAPRLKRDTMNVLHAQYLLPPRAPIPTIVTIHDISFRLFPQWFPLRARRIMNVLIPLSARVATKILTISEHSKRDIARHFRIDPNKIIVTPLAAAARFQPLEKDGARRKVREQFGLSAPYFIGIGLRGARKNTEVVLRAIKVLCERGQWPNDVILALAGTPEQFPFVAASGVAERVHFLGYVDDEALPALYAGALASVYPSFYEGFGLPPLEAMSCACPTLSSNRASLPEVVGEGGQLLAPDDVEAWVAAMRELIGDEEVRAFWGERGVRQAAKFSWQTTVGQTGEIYRQVAR